MDDLLKFKEAIIELHSPSEKLPLIRDELMKDFKAIQPDTFNTKIEYIMLLWMIAYVEMLLGDYKNAYSKIEESLQHIEKYQELELPAEFIVDFYALKANLISILIVTQPDLQNYFLLNQLVNLGKEAKAIALNEQYCLDIDKSISMALYACSVSDSRAFKAEDKQDLLNQSTELLFIYVHAKHEKLSVINELNEDFPYQFDVQPEWIDLYKNVQKMTFTEYLKSKKITIN